MTEIAEWCVAFASRRRVTNTPWWLRGLHPAYRHCFAYRVPSGAPGCTLVVNQIGSRMQADIARVPIQDFTLNLLASGDYRVLMIALEAPPPRPVLRGPLTCVEVVKSLLGITARWTVTPRQLAWQLRALGAQTLRYIPHEGS